MDANRVYAVGYMGTSLYYNGSSWFEFPIGFTGDLNGVYAADANHIWVVGNYGKIIFWNGSYWADQDGGTTKNLYSIEGTGAGNVWAVGAAGTILHWDGATWKKVTGVTTESLGDVWVKPSGEVWAVSQRTLYYFNGAFWTQVPTGFTEGVVCVAGLASDRVWTGRWYGVIHFWNGSDWTPCVVADSGVDIMDIEILDATHMWAVGGGGWGNTGVIAFNAGT